MRVLVTGGAGFIGSHLVRHLVGQPEVAEVVVLDKLTYAGSQDRLWDLFPGGKLRFKHGSIADAVLVEALFEDGLDYVFNLAAETHVDRSIQDAAPFISTNVLGTQVLLEAARKYPPKLFVHVSTDEVYGPVGLGEATEEWPLRPSSPYSASKAAADCLVNAYRTTHAVPSMIIRPCNNYGSAQYPEKAVPLFITRAILGEALPVYGDGSHVREWMPVAVCAAWISSLAAYGKVGETYNIGSGFRISNLDLARMILKLTNRPETLIRFVTDRKGHDARYAVNCRKAQLVKKEVWQRPMQYAMANTVRWYENNRSWWQAKLPVAA